MITDIGLECDFVTPTSAGGDATGLEAIEDPLSGWIVSYFRSMRCLQIVSASSFTAITVDSYIARSYPIV